MPLPQNTVVWASAGTGKTRKLVETYVNLLETGADPLRIVAMTFTEKAAVELRDRVREAITARMHERPAPGTAPQQANWMRCLALLPADPRRRRHRLHHARARHGAAPPRVPQRPALS